MLDTLFWIAVGAFVGWNFPQPFWAKAIQAKIQAVFTRSSTSSHYRIWRQTWACAAIIPGDMK